MKTTTGGISLQILEGNRRLAVRKARREVALSVLAVLAAVVLIGAFFVLISSVFGCAATSSPIVKKGPLVELQRPLDAVVRISTAFMGVECEDREAVLRRNIQQVLQSHNLPTADNLRLTFLAGSSLCDDAQAVVAVSSNPSYGARGRVSANLYLYWRKTTIANKERAVRLIQRFYGAR